MSVSAISTKPSLSSTSVNFDASLDDGKRRAALRDMLARVGISGNVVTMSQADEAVGKLKCDGQNWDYSDAVFRTPFSEPRDPSYVDVEKWVDALIKQGVTV